MKTPQITLLLLCLTTMALAAIPDGECCTTCISALIKDVRPRKGEGKLSLVEIYTLPVTTFETPAADATTEDKAKAVCGQYWTDNGGKTCCKQEDIAKRGKDRKKRLAKRLHHMLHVDIKKGHGKIKKHIKDFLEVIKNETVKKNIIENSSTTDDPITAEMIADGVKLLEIESAKEPENSDGEAERTKAKEKFKKCVETYGNSVIASMCFDCSVKVGNFYDETKQVITASKEYCTAITKDCAALFVSSAKNMALERFLRITNNYMDTKASKKYPIFMGIEKEENYKKLEECGNNPDACAADDTKRKFFCGMISLRDDTLAIFGDGEDTDIDPTKLKARKDGKRLLAQMPRFVNRLLQDDGDNDGFIEEGANGLPLQNIKSGLEFQDSEIPSENEDGDDTTFAKILGSVAILFLMIGAQFF